MVGQDQFVPEVDKFVEAHEVPDIVLGPLAQHLLVDAGAVASPVEVVGPRRTAPSDVRRQLDDVDGLGPVGFGDVIRDCDGPCGGRFLSRTACRHRIDGEAMAADAEQAVECPQVGQHPACLVAGHGRLRCLAGAGQLPLAHPRTATSSPEKVADCDGLIAHPSMIPDQASFGGGRHPSRAEPLLDLCRVEAEQVAPLDERNPALGDEAPDVALVDAEAFGHGGQVHQRQTVGSRWSTWCVLLWRSSPQLGR